MKKREFKKRLQYDKGTIMLIIILLYSMQNKSMHIIERLYVYICSSYLFISLLKYAQDNE
jgi:hypothetical protein